MSYQNNPISKEGVSDLAIIRNNLRNGYASPEQVDSAWSSYLSSKDQTLALDILSSGLTTEEQERIISGHYFEDQMRILDSASDYRNAPEKELQKLEEATGQSMGQAVDLYMKAKLLGEGRRSEKQPKNKNSDMVALVELLFSGK